MVKLTSQIFLLEMKIKYLIDKQSINRSSLGFFSIIMSCLLQRNIKTLFVPVPFFFCISCFCIVIIDSVSFLSAFSKSHCRSNFKMNKVSNEIWKIPSKTEKQLTHNKRSHSFPTQILYLLVQAFKFWMGCRIQHCSTFRCHLFIYFIKDFSKHV